MSHVHYSRLKLGIALILCSVLFWVGVWMTSVFDAKGTFIGAVLAVMSALVMVKFGRYLLDNRILVVSAAGIEFHGIVSTRRLRHDQIAALMVETHSNNFISQRSLVITPVQGAGGKLRIAEKLLEGRVGGIEGLADLIANGPEPMPPARHNRAQPAPRAPTADPAPVRARGFGRKVV